MPPSCRMCRDVQESLNCLYETSAQELNRWKQSSSHLHAENSALREAKGVWMFNVGVALQQPSSDLASASACRTYLYMRPRVAFCLVYTSALLLPSRQPRSPWILRGLSRMWEVSPSSGTLGHRNDRAESFCWHVSSPMQFSPPPLRLKLGPWRGTVLGRPT